MDLSLTHGDHNIDEIAIWNLKLIRFVYILACVSTGFDEEQRNVLAARLQQVARNTGPSLKT